MNTISRSRRNIFWTAVLVVNLAGFESLSFTLTRLRPDLFDRREAFLSRLRPDDFERFKRLAASDTLGWDNLADQTRRQKNCKGVEITYTYDQDRLRVHSAAPARDAVVLVAGDSFTHGDEVADSESFPAALERILQVPVANFGVGGYGPDQAVLKLEGLIDRFPRTRVVVLAIMYENVRRMVNSYRPVYFESTGHQFGLKPYVLDGEFHGLIGNDPFRDFQSMLAAANVGFDTDFWRRPRARFPYTAAVVKAFTLPSFWLPALEHLGRLAGRPERAAIFRLPSVRKNLRAVYERFAHLAQSRNLHAVIALVPANARDQTSGLEAIAAATDTQRAHITFINVGSDFEWSQFRQGGCHPSPAGYRMIAANVARAVAPLLASTAARRLQGQGNGFGDVFQAIFAISTRCSRNRTAYLANQANSSTARANFFTAICWQFCNAASSFLVYVTPSDSDASNTVSKQSRHRAEGLLERGIRCKGRDGSA